MTSETRAKIGSRRSRLSLACHILLLLTIYLVVLSTKSNLFKLGQQLLLVPNHDPSTSGGGALECIDLFRKTRHDATTTSPTSSSSSLLLHDPNGGKLLARSTVTDPSFWISVHVPEVDPVRFVTFDKGKYYEQALTAAFVEILTTTTDDNDDKKKKKKHVIDVGGNIGWYSLLSMALGSTVDVFEPNQLNLLRFCESLCLNGWEECTSSSLLPTIHQAAETKRRARIFPMGVMDKADC